MPASAELIRILASLEESLWRSETRGDRALMDRTFAGDFFEFGRSGRVWGRSAMLFDDCLPIDIQMPLPEFSVRLLDDTIALVTYNSIVKYGATVECARRSSIWSFDDSRWNLRFHQGTPYEPDLVAHGSP